MVERLQAEFEVGVEWRPFYLYWDTPREGLELPPHVLQARAAGSEARLTALAAGYGLPFVSTRRIYHTQLAHEATEYARAHGLAADFHRIVFRQVYAEGLDIGQWPVLRAAASEAGLDPEEMQRTVEAGAYTADVAAQVQRAYQAGISGVPTYVINGRYAVVGAQPLEVFREAFAQIALRAEDRPSASRDPEL